MRILILLFVLHHAVAFSSPGLPSLEADFNNAKKRRATFEETLLSRTGHMEDPGREWTPGKPPKRRGGGGGGGGFGGKSSTAKTTQDNLAPLLSPKKSIKEGKEFAGELERDGFIRINGALSRGMASSLRSEVLELQHDVAEHLRDNNHEDSPESYYGTEPGRTSRIDLLLPFGEHVRTAMDELFVSGGPFRSLFELLCGEEGEFYELAAIITNQGADRQVVHPDLPWREEAPLYVCFCALQDCTLSMGPTTFLPRSQDRGTRDIYDAGGDGKDELLSQSDVATPLLMAGDAIIFDARTLHAGGANTDEETRCLFNFSFRTTSFLGNLGYKGSMRPGYTGKMNLRDVMRAADKGGAKLGHEFGNGVGI